MSILRMLLILGLLLSYVPVFPADDCGEGGHAEDMQIHCGYSFHCPFLHHLGSVSNARLPYAGLFDASPSAARLDEYIRPIFHPPEKAV